MVMKYTAAGWLLLMAVTVAKAEELSCANKVVADIYILLDASNSVHKVGWERSLNFVVNFTKAFPFGPEHVQFAFGTFSSEFNHKINLGQYTDRNDFEQAVNSTVQQKQNSNTYKALIAIKEKGLLTSPTSGARPDVAKILIIVVDGKSDNVPETIAAAKALRDQDVTIIVVGVKDVDRVELEGMAGDTDNVFTAPGFRGLDDLRSQITQRVCVELSCANNVVADIYIVLDASNSVHYVGWERSINFVVNFTKAFPFGPEHVQFAFGTFSSEFIHKINLGQYTDRNDFEKEVNSTVQQKQNSHTYEALIAINEKGLLTSPTSGARPDVAKILIIVIDGQSDNVTKTITAAQALRDQGVTIIAVGVKLIERVELEGMAGDKDNIFTMPGYRDLDGFRSKITQRVCVAKPPNAEQASGQ